MSSYQQPPTQATVHDCIQTYNHTNLQPYKLTKPHPSCAIESQVSPQALALFRLLERLSRRTGYACVKLLQTLANMHGRCLSSTRAHLAELIAAKWIERKQTREGGQSRLFFWPLVQVAARVKSRFSAPKTGGCPGGYPPAKLAVTPSAPFKKTETEDDSKDSAAASAFREVLPESEALELTREAKTHGLDAARIARVVAAYRAQAGRVRCAGAWLREAIRRGFEPPAPQEVQPELVRKVYVAAPPPTQTPPGGGVAAWSSLRAKMGRSSCAA